MECGLGEKEEVVPFYSYILDGNDGASSFYKRIDADVSQELTGCIQIKRLESILREKSIPRIDLLCMDVQGYELNVLKGCGEMLKNVQYIIMEEPKEIINTDYLPEGVCSKYIHAPSHTEIKEFMTANNFVEIERISENMIEDNVMYRRYDYTFNEKVSTPLCEIMGRNQTDKGHANISESWHNYTTFYYSIFKERSQDQLRIFELGLGTNNMMIPCNMGEGGRPGASLYGWAEFFPRATLYGADIDSEILFNTDRISTFYCDQTDPTVIKQMWEEPALTDAFDIIIEDGLHTFAANVCFFENSIHKLKRTGYYIIEDLVTSTIPLYTAKIKAWNVKYPDLVFTILQIPSKNRIDNNLLVVRYKVLG